MQQTNDRLLILDYPALYHRAGEDEATAVEVLEDLKGSAPKELARLTQAFEAADTTTAGRAAHKLKGAFLAVGADRAAATAGEVERLAAVDAEQARREFARLSDQWYETLGAIEEVLARGGRLA